MNLEQTLSLQSAVVWCGTPIPDNYLFVPQTLAMSEEDDRKCIHTYGGRYAPREILEKYRENIGNLGLNPECWIPDQGDQP